MRKTFSFSNHLALKRAALTASALVTTHGVTAAQASEPARDLLAQNPCTGEALSREAFSRLFEGANIGKLNDVGSARFSAAERTCHPFDGCTEWKNLADGVSENFRSSLRLDIQNTAGGAGAAWRFANRYNGKWQTACTSNGTSLWPCGAPRASTRVPMEFSEAAEEQTNTCAQKVFVYKGTNPDSPAGTIERAIILRASYDTATTRADIISFPPAQTFTVFCNTRQWGHQYTCSGSYSHDRQWSVKASAFVSPRKLIFIKKDGEEGFDETGSLGFFQEPSFRLSNGTLHQSSDEETGYYGARRKKQLDINFDGVRLHVRKYQYENHGGIYEGCPTSGWETTCEVAQEFPFPDTGRN